MKRIKENRGYLILTSLVTLIPMLAGILLWKRLPDQVATHFDFAGNADDWSPKSFGVFVLPLLILAIHWFCICVVSADPKHQAISDKVYRMIFWICPAASLFCGISIYGYSLSLDIGVPVLAQLFMGVLFVIIGNYLPKCRQNYTVGIRLPWTLEDTENWTHTHRFAGWVWTIGGLFFIVNAFLMFGGPALTIAVILIMSAVPGVYSFAFYVGHRKDADSL